MRRYLAWFSLARPWFSLRRSGRKPFYLCGLQYNAIMMLYLPPPGQAPGIRSKWRTLPSATHPFSLCLPGTFFDPTVPRTQFRCRGSRTGHMGTGADVAGADVPCAMILWMMVAVDVSRLM